MNYLFDVDGTLTFPRQKMDSQHVLLFLSWMNDKKVFIVAGSDRKKVCQQLPASILARCSGVFCCMANELYDKEKLVYKNNWSVPDNLLFDLWREFAEVEIEGKGKKWYEKRSGMINFSPIGRDVSREVRNKFQEYDKVSNLRKSIAEKLEPKYPDLKFKIGGQISIDIQPKGADKSQATKWVRENVSEEITYFGDKCDEMGNDYEAIQDTSLNGGKIYCVNNPMETIKIIQTIQ
tara:strand:- start:9724 stop:10428 length:705 start_codon:yes stop_codon:yes gene_type:complete